ncbi:hypothetical protein [Coleofasciculus sp. FACHB-1120]|nr:hypothetical protein [Coleofasciculus sp. FACHB-1120]
MRSLKDIKQATSTIISTLSQKFPCITTWRYCRMEDTSKILLDMGIR